MTDRPAMTDPLALKQHRDRATPEGLFLHHAAADEINDRLAMVNKSFTDTAVISGAIGFLQVHFELDAAMKGWAASSA